MKIERIIDSEDKERKAYSEMNPDLDMTVHWLKDLARKYGLIIGEGPLYKRNKPDEENNNIPYQRKNKKT